MIRKTSLTDVLTRRWITYSEETGYDLERRHQQILLPFIPEMQQCYIDPITRTGKIQEETDTEGQSIISQRTGQSNTISLESDSSSTLRLRFQTLSEDSSNSEPETLNAKNEVTCPQCHKLYTGTSATVNLRRHIKTTHLPSRWNRECSVDGCKRRFTRWSYVLAHQRNIHHC